CRGVPGRAAAAWRPAGAPSRYGRSGGAIRTQPGVLRASRPQRRPGNPASTGRQRAFRAHRAGVSGRETGAPDPGGTAERVGLMRVKNKMGHNELWVKVSLKGGDVHVERRGITNRR